MDIENSIKFAIYTNDFEIKSIYEFCKKYYQERNYKIKSKKTIIDEEIPTSIKKIEIDYDIQKLLTVQLKIYSMKKLLIIGGFGFIGTYFLEKYLKNIKLR